jgi:uncharacterized protein YbjT (DUF2867 family)
MAADRAARSGPVVLITGCTSGGIGHALCRYLAGRGCRVFATARRPEAAGGLQAEGIPVLPLDVTVPESCTATVKAVVAAAGRLDVLVNNAGGEGVGGPAAGGCGAIREQQAEGDVRGAEACGSSGTPCRALKGPHLGTPGAAAAYGRGLRRARSRPTPRMLQAL